MQAEGRQAAPSPTCSFDLQCARSAEPAHACEAIMHVLAGLLLLTAAGMLCWTNGPRVVPVMESDDAVALSC